LLAIPMIPCEWGFRFTLYIQGSLSKGQSFSLEASGVSLEFSWGSLFLCEKLPSRSTRNSPNPVWGRRFSGAVPYRSLSVDWRGSDIPACWARTFTSDGEWLGSWRNLRHWEPGLYSDCGIFWPSGWNFPWKTN